MHLSLKFVFLKSIGQIALIIGLFRVLATQSIRELADMSFFVRSLQKVDFSEKIIRDYESALHWKLFICKITAQ